MSANNKCSIQEPMFCSMKDLDAMFNQQKNQFPVEALINAEDSAPENTKWSFDKNTLIIYNNKYWKGFFPTDQNFTAIRYFGGFWKRFTKREELLRESHTLMRHRQFLQQIFQNFRVIIKH